MNVLRTNSCKSDDSIDDGKYALVYICSDHSVSLQPIEVARNPSNRLLRTMEISRLPWKTEQRIRVPRRTSSYSNKISTASDEEMETGCDCYSSTLMFSRISKNMAWKRMTGDVKKIMVFEEPISLSPTAPAVMSKL
ncbi:hypothetical protein CLAFUW4_12551 [Fulvia fulva]|uniref:Uncharacterized protein n=1 Tax=Passalora fulva TaxID=5499 RepID=A0A9Q8PDJ9_PASFU|nr:uncharacterized protein CLAFUR5_11576 [Fulvia fulva]KAK4618339.1 hypothetical protein CLAFUR4_12556 [Fulvia fulva]KAK4618827.1 hypothetical protein CLAFUR0_12567 [Fulvia fulva]UJO20508.1 hypothetical protein CLAFUR5_11576 [Fulvia fulva]WPV18479.1 hypothetical protein CLAFUW4_12551 [Fulvia fulva]WPV32823.1 hypothetical protein CLAFUW7_12558 [Fulvia fulva]